MGLTEEQLRWLRDHVTTSSPIESETHSWPPKVPFGLGKLDPIVRRVIINLSEAQQDTSLTGPSGGEISRYLREVRET